MKILYVFVILIFIASTIKAEINRDTLNKKTLIPAETVKVIPRYPGGDGELDKYLRKNLKLSAIAKSFRLKGLIIFTFVVEKDGSLTGIRPVRRRGIDCETEESAIQTLYNSSKWEPATENGKPVRVQFSIPLIFHNSKPRMITFKELQKSDLGFLFYINGKTYTINEASTILGDSFLSNDVEFAEPYGGYNSYQIPGKKETYLIKVL